MSIAVLATDGEADGHQSMIIIAQTGATPRKMGSWPVFEHHAQRNEDERILDLVVESAMTPTYGKSKIGSYCKMNELPDLSNSVGLRLG